MKKPCKPFPLVHLQILNSQKQMNNNRQQTEMKPFLRYMNLNSRLYPKAFSSFVQHNVKWAKVDQQNKYPLLINESTPDYTVSFYFREFFLLCQCQYHF